MTNELKKNLKFYSILVFVAFVFSALVGLRIEMEKAKEINREQEIEILANRKLIAEHAKFMSIVRGLTKVAKNMSPEQIVEVADKIAMWCILNEDIGLAPNIIFGTMEAESDFDPTAISHADAYGLMQCIRATFEIHLPDMGYGMFTEELALNPIINVEVGMRELVRLRKYWLAEGYDDWMITMTSYYWGIKWTKRRFLNKGVEESEYGKEVLDKAQGWKKDIG